MFVPLFLFSIGVMSAVTVCTIWGKIGADERFETHQNLKRFLHIVHHWMFGLALVCISPLSYLLLPIKILVFFILGLGTGLFLDDVIFHTYGYYFQRKES